LKKQWDQVTFTYLEENSGVKRIETTDDLERNLLLFSMKLEILNRVMLELPDTACQAGGLSYDLKPFSGLGIAIFNTKFGRIGELEVYTSYILHTREAYL
jgi:hypothetical protein